MPFRKPGLQITDRLHGLLVRLMMAGVSMALVCWIGWFVPASDDAAPHDATAVSSVGRASVAPLLLQESTRPVERPAEYPKRKSSGQRVSHRLDVNQATAQELEQLPGIGPVLAGRIVEYRMVRGAFTEVDDVRRVKGIGRKTLERIRALIAVEPPVRVSGRKTA